MTAPGANLGSVYLDANVLIYAIEGVAPWTSLLSQLFRLIETEDLRAVSSEITLAEVLAKPLAMSATDLAARYEMALGPDSQIEVVPVGRNILKSAAMLRGANGLKLVDAIHLATALDRNCSALLTNDQRLGEAAPAPLHWLPLDGLQSVLSR